VRDLTPHPLLVRRLAHAWIEAITAAARSASSAQWICSIRQTWMLSQTGRSIFAREASTRSAY